MVCKSAINHNRKRSTCPVCKKPMEIGELGATVLYSFKTTRVHVECRDTLIDMNKARRS